MVELSTSVVVALVIPLYGLAAGILWKLSSLRVTDDDVEENISDIEENVEKIDENEQEVRKLSADVHDLCRKIDHIADRINQLERNQKTIHDLVRDQNHCGAETCKWCEHDGKTKQ